MPSIPPLASRPVLAEVSPTWLAEVCAQARAATSWVPVLADEVPRDRWYIVGDPQTSLERFFTALARRGLLTRDGRMRPSVGVVSVGDHFDWGRAGVDDLEAVSRDGEAALRWLASHPPDQVVILAGNHDLSRVMELAFESDTSFAEARDAALALGDAAPDTRVVEAFHERFRHIPTPEVAARDLSSFCVSQRVLVQSLLLEGRLRLAASGRWHDHPVLITHAGVTNAQLKLLGLPPDAPARDIARALNRALRRAVDAVRSPWSQGTRAALSLHPLHTAGRARFESGGLLSHRPGHPDLAHPENAARWNPHAPRRFDPRAMPVGLAQVCGHTSHARCLTELAPWIDDLDAMPSHASLRTLASDGETVVYRVGLQPHLDTLATLYMVDAALHRAPDLDDVIMGDCADVVALE